MKIMVFPGQGAQFSGMGQDMYEAHAFARDRFAEASEILGFDIASIMFSGSDEDLKQTKVTQPAIFLYSVILAEGMGKAFDPSCVAGHSLLVPLHHFLQLLLHLCKIISELTCAALTLLVLPLEHLPSSIAMSAAAG